MRFAAVAVFLFAAVGVVAKHITLEAEVGDPRMIQTSALHETPGKSLEGECEKNRCLVKWDGTTEMGKTSFRQTFGCASKSKCKDDGKCTYWMSGACTQSNKCTWRPTETTATCS